MKPDDLYATPNALAKHYSKFRVNERLLLTGHSHQAWPDCGYEAQKHAWQDAAEYADDKWSHAFAKADRVRCGYARLLDDNCGEIALASNTHDLVVRFLSALPLKSRSRLVTTDGEYHSVRRQADRLAEEGIEIVRVAAEPVASLADRLIEAVDKHTAAVLVSAVMFRTAQIVPDLGRVVSECDPLGIAVLVDAYHAINAIPFSLQKQKLERAFIVGGGYKYCQLGEGNCFLRFPSDCGMRPVITGWFSEFSALADSKKESHVAYGRGGDRFAGSTYDPTSHYRGSAVFEFFEENKLTPSLLRDVSQHQIGLLAARFDEWSFAPTQIDRDRTLSMTQIAGFLALRSPNAQNIYEALRVKGVLTDYRGDFLRLGPAPYLSDAQLHKAMDLLHDVVSANA